MTARNSAAAADRELVITRVFDAPRHLVYRAWAEDAHIRQWSMPHGFTMESGEREARPGGAWRFSMRGPDGVEHRASGVFREVVEDELLVFTHAWEDAGGKRGHETLVTVRFEDLGGRTRMTFRQAVFESTASRDGHRGGWSECFERLQALLARQQEAHAR